MSAKGRRPPVESRVGQRASGRARRRSRRNMRSGGTDRSVLAFGKLQPSRAAASCGRMAIPIATIRAWMRKYCTSLSDPPFRIGLLTFSGKGNRIDIANLPRHTAQPREPRDQRSSHGFTPRAAGCSSFHLRPKWTRQAMLQTTRSAVGTRMYGAVRHVMACRVVRLKAITAIMNTIRILDWVRMYLGP